MTDVVTVLIVEDEGLVAKDIEYSLSQLGYQVAGIATTGPEAIAVAQSARPDIILMDIVLRGSMDGIQAAEIIHQSQDIPVVYLTAYADDATLSRVKATYPYGYVVKPFETRELNAVIETALHRHQLEQEVATSYRWLAATLDTLQDAVVSTDTSGLVTCVNRSAAQLTGWSADDATGHPVTEVVNLTSTDGAPPLAHPTLLALHTAISIPFAPETHLRDRHGQLQAVEGSAAPILHRDQVQGTVTAFRDVSKQRELQETLQSMQQQVVQQERLSSMGLMASGIAHNFNNILVPILGYSELPLTNPDLLNNRDLILDYFRKINVAALDAANVVSRLREFYQQRSGRETPGWVNMAELVEQVIALTQPIWHDLAQQRGIPIELRSELNAVPAVEGIASDLRDALVNLVLNAIEAMPEGGQLTLRSRLETGDRATVVVEISDTGVGMSPEVQQRCLDPFFTTKGREGTGLGLATAYQVVRRHDGRLEIHSQPGQGTTFVVCLPVPLRQGETQTLLEGLTPVQGLRILVVDDDPAVLTLLSQYLQLDQHQVTPVAQSVEGLQRFQTDSFDLVILDRAMPTLNGDQLAATLKALAPDCPVLMLTGFGDLMSEEERRAIAVDQILSKPITLATLRHAIARLVQ